ncbi:hypothetical protein GCK72_016890 [Caenorhabditis remanei]|uniref:Uncharacterized protein n=1 Tax=Caenorhabditis remanei TaxID=31234 RepID=A0A6A5G6K1_CAERE|nr:hypothetical protein GCK72_016890 [Caenorhabditis remanei]KAF1750341.1 hypothetical protein GCK72_016890 [Caenorhabditis remanei]
MERPPAYFVHMMTGADFMKTYNTLSNELVHSLRRCQWFADKDEKKSLEILLDMFYNAFRRASTDRGVITLKELIDYMMQNILKTYSTLRINNNGNGDSRRRRVNWIINKLRMDEVNGIHKQSVNFMKQIPIEIRRDWINLSAMSALMQVTFEVGYQATSCEWSLRLSQFCVTFFEVFLDVFCQMVADEEEEE